MLIWCSVVTVTSYFYFYVLLRLTQLCQKHIPKRKKLHDQALRAGKVDELTNLETNAHAPQLEWFVYGLVSRAVFIRFSLMYFFVYTATYMPTYPVPTSMPRTFTSCT